MIWVHSNPNLFTVIPPLVDSDVSGGWKHEGGGGGEKGKRKGPGREGGLVCVPRTECRKWVGKGGAWDLGHLH